MPQKGFTIMQTSTPASISSLYPFRTFKNSRQSEPDMHANRRRAARKMVTYLNQGHDASEFIAQKRENGEWVDDSETFNTMSRLIEQNGGKSNTSKQAQLTPKKAASQLAQAARLAASSDVVSQEHMDAIQDLYNQLVDAYNDAE